MRTWAGGEYRGDPQTRLAPDCAGIRRQLATGGHASADDYLLSLLRQAMRKRGWELAEKLVLEGLASGEAKPMTEADWERLRRAAQGVAEPKAT